MPYLVQSIKIVALAQTELEESVVEAIELAKGLMRAGPEFDVDVTLEFDGAVTKINSDTNPVAAELDIRRQLTAQSFNEEENEEDEEA